MLSIDEFTCGSLNEAPPLSLMLAIDNSGSDIIVGRIGDKRAAIFLSGEYMYQYFLYENNDTWKGLIVYNTIIEIDEKSAFSPTYLHGPLGSIIRTNNKICIAARSDGPFRDTNLVSLRDDLEKIPDSHRVGFLRWQITVGTGIEKRVLKTIVATPPTAE